MSLILEALKRSDAQRRLGETPELLAPAVAMPPSARESRMGPLLPIVGIALVATAIVGAAWWWSRSGIEARGSEIAAVNGAPVAPDPAIQAPPLARPSAPPANGAPELLGAPMYPVPARAPASAAVPFVAPPASTPPVTPSAPTPTLPAPPDPMAPLPPPDTVAGRSPVTVEPQPAPAADALPVEPAIGAASQTNVQAGPAPAPAATGEDISAGSGTAATQPTGIPNSVAVGVPPVVAAQPTTADAPPLMPTSSNVAPAPDRSDLPLAVRQSLPPLVLNMHLYRTEPGERVVILDGARMGEGDSSGEVSVEEIRNDGVILEVRGQRFLLSRLPR